MEGLVPEAGTWKLDTSVAYGNREDQGLQIGNPLIIQTGPTSFVSVYTDVGEERKNTDIVVGTVGLRYGLTTRTELYVRASAFGATRDPQPQNLSIALLPKVYQTYGLEPATRSRTMMSRRV